MKDTRIHLISAIVLLLSTIYGLYAILDTRLLDKYYIFSPDRLHALSRNSIHQHGNDTKALVAGIIDQLRTDESIAPHLNVDEEWVFNNAGGAMGAMYIIHASE